MKDIEQTTELDLIKQRLKLNIREYSKIIEKDNRSVTRLKRLGVEIRRDMLMVEDNYWEYLLMEVKKWKILNKW